MGLIRDGVEAARVFLSGVECVFLQALDEAVTVNDLVVAGRAQFVHAAGHMILPDVGQAKPAVAVIVVFFNDFTPRDFKELAECVGNAGILLFFRMHSIPCWGNVESLLLLTGVPMGAGIRILRHTMHTGEAVNFALL